MAMRNVVLKKALRRVRVQVKQQRILGMMVCTCTQYRFMLGIKPMVGLTVACFDEGSFTMDEN